MKIKLQEILDNKNISVYSLSKEIGVTQNNLGKIVKGETTSIKYDILEKLCNMLDITPNDIFEIEPQLTIFDYNNTNKKNLLNTETLEIIDKIKNGNNYTNDELCEEDELYEIEQIQERLDIEYTLEENLELIINSIISNADLSSLPIRIRKEIEAYRDQNTTSFQFKFILSYRSLYTLIVKQSNSKPLINFISKIIKIYNNGGLYEISDNELMNFINESNNLLNTYKKD
jgi:putative transcriptional regulator